MPSEVMNKPRNVLLPPNDIREPVIFQFQHSIGALKHSITVQQTPEEVTWPGGALWDCGLLLAELLLAVAGIESSSVTIVPEATEAEKSRTEKHGSKQRKKSSHTTTTITTNHLSSRLKEWLPKSRNASQWKTVEDVLLHTPQLQVVELGCGVGLTGLVASAALGAATTILTDLTQVVESVTHDNVLRNCDIPSKATGSGKGKTGSTTSNRVGGSSNKASSYPEISHRWLKHFKGGGKVLDMPLCWGNEAEGQAVLDAIQALKPKAQAYPSTASAGANTQKRKGVKKQAAELRASDKSISSSSSSSSYIHHDRRFPDLILLGDVAYQHKPGAPSHFDVLIETLQQLMPPRPSEAEAAPTLLMFGIRLRMPASMDLLLLLQEHFVPVLEEPIPAEILDPSLLGKKHNMTIHIFQNKVVSKESLQ